METKLREFGRLICRIAAGAFMNREEAREAYRQVIQNEQPELQQGAFLMAHITRGPSTEELAGAWDALDRYDTSKLVYTGSGIVCDIVGTGSDSLKTVNCSSPASLIAAAAGLTVAKKGARLVTGVSGASDIFEILGIDLQASLADAQKALHECGICYLPGEAFLQQGWARLIRTMRFTSAFNIVGPLTRPCGDTSHIVIGAYSPEICDQLIDILKEIDMKGAIAPFGRVTGRPETEGMDEFSLCGPTRVTELKNGKISTYEVTPRDFGCEPCAFEEIQTFPTAAKNAHAIMEVLSGNNKGALASFFCINAAAALYLAQKAADYKEGMEMAQEALFSGKALQKLNLLRKYQGL
ncbi:MAG: anthranilate phosphoribosyltransferase [Acidobacteriota bacterium]|jgi:anthranilate phosphoribosyltransferase|nr:anthranilate phosphoribosyltransferase [Acidobacteriota bacterium]